MKNRAPYILAGVPVLGCESCQFLCSDERYLKAHNVVEHKKEPDDPPAPHENAAYIEAVRTALTAGTRKKKEIEAAIEATSKTLGHLYAALLANNNAGTFDAATEIMDRVIPNVESENTPSPGTPATPETSRCRITSLISPPDNQLSRKRKVSIETSNSEEATSLNLNETGEPVQTSFVGLSRLNQSTPLSGLSDMERAQAIIDTIKRARLVQQKDETDEEDPVIVQPTGPPLESVIAASTSDEGKAASDSGDEIIEIPIDEPDNIPNGFNQTPFNNNQNPALHHLLNHTSNNRHNQRYGFKPYIFLLISNSVYGPMHLWSVNSEPSAAFNCLIWKLYPV